MKKSNQKMEFKIKHVTSISMNNCFFLASNYSFKPSNNNSFLSSSQSLTSNNTSLYIISDTLTFIIIYFKVNIIIKG